METTPHHSYKTKLHDRTLWYDGDSTIAANEIVNALSKRTLTTRLYTDILTEDIRQYNKLVLPSDQITIKHEIASLDYTWNIPEFWSKLDVDNYIHMKFIQECKLHNWDADDRATRIDRICKELQLYDHLGLVDVLRTLIYIINTLEEENVIWGIGRGSSVASYVLYLIGVHDIDSIYYGLDITDFLRA